MVGDVGTPRNPGIMLLTDKGSKGVKWLSVSPVFYLFQAFICRRRRKVNLNRNITGLNGSIAKLT